MASGKFLVVSLLLVGLLGFLAYWIFGSNHGVRRPETQGENRRAAEIPNVGEFEASDHQPSLKAGDVAQLSALYADLRDVEKFESWGDVIRKIASVGESDNSTTELIEFIERDEPGIVQDSSFRVTCTQKMDAVMYLGFTDGTAAQDYLMRVFRFERENDINALWLPRLHRITHIDQPYFFRNVLRGRAAIGMLISGNRESESLVRGKFEILRNRLMKSQLDQGEIRLFTILVDSLAIGDITKSSGRNFLLVERFGEDGGYQAAKRQARERYLSKDLEEQLLK